MAVGSTRKRRLPNIDCVGQEARSLARKNIRTRLPSAIRGSARVAPVVDTHAYLVFIHQRRHAKAKLENDQGIFAHQFRVTVECENDNFLAWRVFAGIASGAGKTKMRLPWVSLSDHPNIMSCENRKSSRASAVPTNKARK